MSGIPGFSATSIERMISHSNSLKRERQREELISQQSNLVKELPLTYELVEINFDVETRQTKLTFIQTRKYRTIDRYVTKDYVRYPIYSDWKKRTKNVYKSIKLTNSVLESLNYNDDELISEFAIDIINSIGKEDLCPSWYRSQALQLEEKSKVDKLVEDISSTNKITKDNNDQLEKHIASNSDRKTNINKRLTVLDKKRFKIEGRIEKLSKNKPNFWTLFFTLGLIKLLYTNKHINKLQGKFTTLLDEINNLRKESDDLDRENLKLNDEILQNKLSASSHEKEQRKKILKLASELTYNLSHLKPLPTVPIIDNDDFVPLKVFIGYDYHKIIGCYIIHNIENGRCYVGQSKDVIRRLHQHFNGTVPKNIIFAEDYYSYLGEKENLFEVKIIPCETKDELDCLEKSLIERYDALKDGYNRTSGNT